MNPYLNMGAGKSNGGGWWPAVVVGGVLFGIMLAFVLVVTHHERVNDQKEIARVQQAAIETRQTLCSFMSKRAQFVGQPSDTPAARERNNVLAAEAQKLVVQYHC